jgi:hypothetical protein
MPVKEPCLKGGFSDANFYEGRSPFGGVNVPDARRLRELERQNVKLNRLLADPGITCRMSRCGDCWDRAAMERFFSAWKIERIDRKRYATSGDTLATGARGCGQKRRQRKDGHSREHEATVPREVVVNNAMPRQAEKPADRDLERDHQDDPQKAYREQLPRASRSDPADGEVGDQQDHHRAGEYAELARLKIAHKRLQEDGAKRAVNGLSRRDNQPDEEPADQIAV